MNFALAKSISAQTGSSYSEENSAFSFEIQNNKDRLRGRLGFANGNQIWISQRSSDTQPYQTNYTITHHHS